MSDVDGLFFLPFDDEDGGADDLAGTLDVDDDSPFSFWPSPSPHPTFNFADFFVPVFSPDRSRRRPGTPDFDFDDDEPVSLAPDLFAPPPPREIPGEGLRVAGFGSDPDSDVAGGGGGDASDLHWDCFRIDDDDHPDEGFEWEEVDGRLGEREVLSMMLMGDGGYDRMGDLGRRETGGNVGGEDVLAGNVAPFSIELLLERNEGEAAAYLGDDDDLHDFIHTSEYEIMLGQFAEQESALRGSPPASKSVVENLPSITLTVEDAAKCNTLCAVCKDEISLQEAAKQLPCLHHYHGDCILPWLEIRNTCPVCRYELPTEDPEYESSRACLRRSAESSESLGRYDIEMPW